MDGAQNRFVFIVCRKTTSNYVSRQLITPTHPRQPRGKCCGRGREPSKQLGFPAMRPPPSTFRVITAALAATFLLAPRGARAQGGLYDIQHSAAKASVGAKGTTSVTIATKNGWHVNAEAPITLSLTPPVGITLPKSKLARADLASSTL